MSFTERLRGTLTLNLAGKEHRVPGASLRALELDLRSDGFDAAVEFAVAEDENHGGGMKDAILADFLKPDLAKATLVIEAAHPAAEQLPSTKPMELSGIVVRKSLWEEPSEMSVEQPVLRRRYRVELSDAARALWSQHHPCELHTGESAQDVIEGHTGEHVSLQCQLPALQETQSIFFLHLPRGRGCSFRDFVIWLSEQRGGAFRYDYAEQSAAICDAVDPGDQQVLKLFGDDVATHRLVLPQQPRHEVHTHNSYAEEPKSEVYTSALSGTGMRHDELMRSLLAADLDALAAGAERRLAQRDMEVELDFARMPSCNVLPGQPLSLSGDQRWSRDSSLLGAEFRVYRTRLFARLADDGHEPDLLPDSATFQIDMRAWLETRASTLARHPEVQPPHYPGQLEAKVVSERGAEGEETYQIYPDDETSIDYYRVRVPLFDDQQVDAPFEPFRATGKLYVPAYKDQRVLLDLYLDHARVHELLDWGTNVALQQDGQGEHLLFGKTLESQTSLRHFYEDDQPVFKLARTHDADTARIEIREGLMTIEVRETEGG